jgi:hypothetical protein
MKLFLIPIGMLVAGISGYVLEPSLRLQLTGKASNTSGMIGNEAVLLQLPDGKRINLSSLSAEQLPKLIYLKKDFILKDTASGVAISIAAGSEVNLIRIDGFNAVISQGQSGFEVSVPVANTDLFQKLTGILLPDSAPVAPVLQPVTPPQAAPVKIAPTPEPMPSPALEPIPETTVDLALASEQAPTPEPTPVEEASPVDTVEVMKESIRAGQIKEFAFEAVSDWKAEPDEIIDGETYQIGVASYKAETILGMKTLQAKALIKGGKIQHWVRPKTGTEIK